MLGSPTPPPAPEASRAKAPGYRRDIDGLRALAILAVILFHATPWLPGGYVGVDVFFVISGFLITGQIASDLDARRFSLATFWVRRVRRIWPAAFVLTLAVLAIGWWLLMPRDYGTTARDAMAQALMIANVHLWKNVPQGYFAASSDTRPLLHMWSLAVEEQFYVFLPLGMMALWRLGRSRCTWLLAIIAMFSFVASVAWLPGQPKAVFYLLPFRAWELLLGSLLALGKGRQFGFTGDESRSAMWRLLAEAGSVLGLGMIIGCCFGYAKNTAFPAAAAVPPCVGAALVIAACCAPAGREPIVNRLLSFEPLPTIGKVSYSLYLWHWPVLACIRYCIAEPSVQTMVLAMAAILPVSYGSWRWIEQPFRLRLGHGGSVMPAGSTSIAAWRPVAVGGLAWISVYAAGWAIDRKDGVPSRLNPAEQQFLGSSAPIPEKQRFLTASFREREAFLDRPLPEALDIDVFPSLGAESAGGGPDFLLWGDSHGLMLSDAIDAAARRHGAHGYAALMGGTVPLPGVWNGVKQREALVCEKWSRMVTDWIRLHRPRHVLVCANWVIYSHVQRINGKGRKTRGSADVLQDGLQRLLEECEAVGAGVTVMLQVPTQESLPSQRVVLAHCSGRSIDLRGVDRAALQRQQATILAAVAGVASKRIDVVDLADPFFGQNGISSIGDAGGSWYLDRNHVSAYGASRLFEPLLGDMMATMVADRHEDAMVSPVR